jgi:hypothetical protein
MSLCITRSHGLFQNEQKSLSRRNLWIESAKSLAGLAGVLAIIREPALAASKAKGAAELDFEFYMRDLMGGNKREGTILPSETPKAAPPRTLTGPLIPFLINKECSPSCIPVQALIQQIQKQPSNTKSVDDIANDIQNKVQALREKISKSFYTRSPWEKESMMDQYYLDLTAYALWRTAAELLPNFVERDQFVRTLGKLLYEKLLSENLLQKSPTGISTTSLVTSLPAIIEMLDLFKSSNFCTGYKIRRDDISKADDPVFDELDDESLVVSGLSVDCLVSVYEPATLGGSLQINGEQSRFGPDFVGTTLAALFDAAGVKSSWETFFVDPEYRYVQNDPS